MTLTLSSSFLRLGRLEVFFESFNRPKGSPLWAFQRDTSPASRDFLLWVLGVHVVASVRR